MVFRPSGPASIDDDELQLALAMSRSGGSTGAMPSHQPQAQVSTTWQGCGSAFISSGSGSSILGWIPMRFQSKNWQNITAEKKLNFFGSKTTIYLSLGLHKERPSYRRSLQLSKETIQHFKTWTKKFFSTFGSFCPPGYGYGSGFRIPDPLTRLNLDPDPQPCCID
jgi:hypothetical protein